MIIELAHSKASFFFFFFSLNMSVKALGVQEANFKTMDLGGRIMDSAGHHFSAHLLNTGLYNSR